MSTEQNHENGENREIPRCNFYKAIHDYKEEGIDLAKVALQIQRGQRNFNPILEGCCTALMLGAIVGNEHFVKSLIQQGSDINYKNKHSYRALHVAVVFGNTELFQILMKNTHDVNYQAEFGLSPLHLAARSGQTKSAVKLMSLGADVTLTDENGFMPVHTAAFYGNLDLFPVLITSDNDANYQTKDGVSPLHLAIQSGRTESATKLLSLGADATLKDKDGLTALHKAAYFGLPDLFPVLITNETDVNYQSKDGFSPLHAAAFCGQTQCATKLLSLGADATLNDKDGLMPLHTAAVYGHHELFPVLITSDRDVNYQTKDGRSLLHIAASKGHIGSVEQLLKLGADATLKDKNGLIPLHYAASNGYPECFLSLITNEADVNFQIEDGRSLLHIAASKGHIDSVKQLLTSGANASAKDKNAKTPLHYAAEYDHPKCFPMLITNYADVNYQKKNSRSLLHIAASKGDIDCVEQLLKLGANVSLKDKNGKTFLDYNFPGIRKVYKDFKKKIPREIRREGGKAVDLYCKALKKGSFKSNIIRCMFVGHHGVGKTTLVKGILAKSRQNTKSTDGVKISDCYYNTEKKKWRVRENHSEFILGIDNTYQIQIWDFAGQQIYQSTHQTYLSSRCLYFLVFDLSLGLHGQIKDDDLDLQRRVIDYIEFWIGSIMTYGKSDRDEDFPKLVAIGTHKDKVPNFEDIKKEICQQFKQYIDSGHLIVRDDLFVNALDVETNLLREVILEYGTTYPDFGEDIPKAWLNLYKEFSVLREQGTKVLSLEKVWKINDTLKEKVPSKKEMSLFLTFLHNLGYCLYFKEGSEVKWEETTEAKFFEQPGQQNIDETNVFDVSYQRKEKESKENEQSDQRSLENIHDTHVFEQSDQRNHVFLEPEWIISSITCIITCSIFQRYLDRILQWIGVIHQGRISISRMMKIWKKENYRYFYDYKRLLRLVMEKLDLICSPIMYDENGELLESTEYYVPCMVKGSAPNEILSILPETARMAIKNKNKLKMTFTFKNCLPPAVYHRLICSALSLWPVYNEHLYQDACIIRVGVDVLVHFARKAKGIAIFVIPTNAHTNEDHNLALCRTIRTYATEKINNIISLYDESVIENPEKFYSFQYHDTTEQRLGSEFKFGEGTCPVHCQGLTEKENVIKLNDLQLVRFAMGDGIDPQTELPLTANLLQRPTDLLTIKHDFQNYGLKNIMFVVLYRWKKAKSPKAIQLVDVVNECDMDKHLVCLAIRKANVPLNPKHCEFLDERPNEEILDSVLILMSTELIQFGLELKLTFEDILRCRMDCHSTAEIIKKILHMWLHKNDANGSAKMSLLYQAILNCGCDIGPVERKMEEQKQRRKQPLQRIKDTFAKVFRKIPVVPVLVLLFAIIMYFLIAQINIEFAK